MNEPFDHRSLPRPTDEQYAAFAEHIANAHSWYKHLPLLTGGQFLVFLAPDSGIGRLVARIDGGKLHLETPPEGPVFTEASPRLHYSWTTSEEYRRRFGYLDYAYRYRDDQTFGRDVGGPMELPADLPAGCGFTLFPYVSDVSHGTTLRSKNEEALAQLRAGVPHPRREAVLEWARLAEEGDAIWQGMTDRERETVYSTNREEVKAPMTTPAIERYLAIGAEAATAYNKRLRSGEVAKIGAALDQLRAWLDGR